MSYATLRASASLAAVLIATTSTAWAQGAASAPAVVTDIPVIHSLTAMVTQGVGAPVLMLEGGADPHDFSLRPSQARAVAQAGLAVWLGSEITPWMGRAVQNLAPGAQMQLLQVEGLHLQPYLEQRLIGAAADAAAEHAHSHDHGDDHRDGDDHGDGENQGHGHDHGAADDHTDDDHGHGDQGHDSRAHTDDHEHDHDDHGHDGQSHDGQSHDGHAHDGAIDPHAWMDLGNAARWMVAIADRLSEIDPANAETYRANAAAGQDRLAALREELQGILAPVGDAGMVMYHDAYGYLAHEFGLNILGSIALGDATTPGAARLSAIRASLESSGAVCIFPEVNHPDAYVGLVTEGATLRVGVPLDPAGVMQQPGPALYEATLRQMAEAIADCMSRG